MFSKKNAFTLVEILMATVLFSMIFVVIVQLYGKMVKTKIDVEMRQSLIQNSYYLLEKLNVIIKDYTIDYEEYFNRSMVGCSGDSVGNNFTWDVGSGGYCRNFTAYGNANSFDINNTGLNELYWCSSITQTQNNVQTLVNGEGCSGGTTFQSFGNYKTQFIDVKTDVDQDNNAVGDEDDVDLGAGPTAIYDTTGVRELYLISNDKKHRILIRRKLISTGTWIGFPNAGSDVNKLYSIQMLKLRGFDAGENHNFDTAFSGVYDGKIDTWACDTSQGFICNGTGVGDDVFSGYKLPSDQDDGWIDVFGKDITVTDLSFQIFPTKDPQLAWSGSDYQINPYINVSLRTNLYGGIWRKKVTEQVLLGYTLDLQTTFNTRNNY